MMIQGKRYPRNNLTQRRTKVRGTITNKPFKSKIKSIEDDLFEVGSVKNAAQFLRSLLNIADHVQTKYNSEVGGGSSNLNTTSVHLPKYARWQC